jgi:type I restriction enzyme R subunit
MQIKRVTEVLGLNETLLIELTKSRLTESNINELGRLKRLIDSVDRSKAKSYFEKQEGQTLSDFTIGSKISKSLREFLLYGKFDVFAFDDN